jgi:uracil-DNA glycosylase
MKPVPPPPSLKNIYKNLQADEKLNFKPPKHGDLTKWA